MASTLPTTMKAIAIDSFGGVDKLKLQPVSVPKIDADEVLLKVEYAGIGVWDPFEREGGFAEMYAQIYGHKPTFPHVIGSEGAGTVAAIGSDVKNVKVGDRVYAASFLNAKGGLYAEYAAVKANITSTIPGKLTAEEASVFGGDAGTALRGLDDVLKLKAGETALIFGAGGGLGHFAVQIAKRLGARVFAVASGADGVALAKKIGADAAVDGRKEDIVAAARAFAPGGIDVALFTAGGEAANKAITTLKANGRAAHPNGVDPVPNGPDGKPMQTYDGGDLADLIPKLNKLVESGPFVVNVAKTFPLADAAAAHQFLSSHYLGKLALKI